MPLKKEVNPIEMPKPLMSFDGQQKPIKGKNQEAN
jgi:hypothetical protein